MTQAELNKARNLRNQIRNEESRLQILRAAVGDLVPIMDGMPHAQAQSSRVENSAVPILELQRKIQTLKEQFQQACNELLEKFSRINFTPQEQAVITLRYVSCLSFNAIRAKINLSDARIFYIHRHALNKLKNFKAGMQSLFS